MRSFIALPPCKVRVIGRALDFHHSRALLNRRRQVAIRMFATLEVVVREVEALVANEPDAAVVIHVESLAPIARVVACAIRRRLPVMTVQVTAKSVHVGDTRHRPAHDIFTNLGVTDARELEAHALIEASRAGPSRRVFLVTADRHPAVREL